MMSARVLSAIKVLLLTILWLGLSLQAHSATLVKPEYRWKKSNIKVCVLEFRAPAAQLLSAFHKYAIDGFIGLMSENWLNYVDQAQDIVNAHYTKQNTIVHFTGWKPCSLTQNPDAYLFFFDEPKFNGASFSDAARLLVKPGTLPIVGINVNMRGLNEHSYSFFSTSLIHEFGHLAGLLHEHTRAESVTRSKCLQKITDGAETKRSCLSSYTEHTGYKVFHGPYDNSSVMDYCQMNNLRYGIEPVALSASDKAALKYLFKNLPEN